MKKRLISLLLVLSLVLGSTIALASCDGSGDDETGDNDTSTETESVVDTDKATESNDEDTDKVTESDKTTENNTESETQVPSETEPTQVPSETEPTQVPSETEPTEVPSETEPTEVPSETEPAEVPSETEPESETGCDGNHYAATDDQGHYLDACDFCGTEGNATMEVHEYKTVNGMPTCKVCGWVASCEGVHDYAKAPAGHWKPACDACGKGEGKIQDHEYEQRVEDEGDLLVYMLVCTVCKYRAYEQEVPYEINSFYSASELAYADINGSLQGSFAVDSGVGYAAYSSSNGGSATVTVVSNEEIGDPSGHYLVMKVRLPKSQNGFTASIKSAYAQNYFNMSFTNISSGWVVLIVDATKAVGTNSGYQPNYIDEYYLEGLRISAIAGPGESFDVAYVMMCDTIEDAQSFVDADTTKTAVIRYDDIVNGAPDVDKNQCVDEDGNPIIHTFIVNDDGTHTLEETCYQCGLRAVSHEPHSVSQVVVDGIYKRACTVCGYVEYDYNIKAEATGIFMSPDYFLAPPENHYVITTTEIRTDEDGTPYCHIEDVKTWDGWGYGDLTIYNSEANPSAGRYIILKVRRPNVSDLNLNSLTFWITSVAGCTYNADGSPNWVGGEVTVPLAEDNQWHTIVVDLGARTTDYVPDENGNYGPRTIHIRPFGWDTECNDTTNEAFDIGYVALCDSMDDIKDIISSETYEWSVNSGTTIELYTANNGCISEHAYSKAQVIDGVYKIVCDICGNDGYNYNIKEEAAGIFMDPDYLYEHAPNYSSGFTQKTILNDEDENGMPYLHLEDTYLNWNYGDLTPYESDANPTAGRYFVMKVRRPESDLHLNTLECWITSVAGITFDDNGDPNWVAGYVEISLPEDGEWHTIVVDLGARADGYTPDENDNYGPRTVHIRAFGGDDKCNDTTNEVFDIAYMVFCDSMDDLKDVISDTTYEWSVDGSTNLLLNTSNNSCVEDHAIGETEENGTYSYACTVCGQTFDSITVPESVTKYYSAYSIATTAKDYYSPDGSGTKSLKTDDGFYAEFTNMTQAIWQRNHLDMVGDQTPAPEQRFTENVGNANYLVIKIKSDDAAGKLSLNLSTTAKNGETSLATEDHADYHGTDGEKGVLTGEEYVSSWGCTTGAILKEGDATGEWITYVIDLAAVYGDYYSKAEGEDDYVVDFFVLELAGKVDVSYVAFVEGDWADIAEVTGESKVIQITDLEGTSKTVSTADGSEIVTESDENE